MPPPESAGASALTQASQAASRRGALYARWLQRSLAVIAESAAALNAMNVFPVSDADTGSNLELTLAGIAEAVPDLDRVAPEAVVRAAVLSAHGNSGAILAEMITSVCRLLGDGSAAPELGRGRAVATVLRTAAHAATRAVARPVAGTILTVADAAADAATLAAAETPSDGLAVVRAAQTAARQALARTPEQLDVLAEAGVVDAGGQAYVVLLDVLAEVLGGEAAEPITAIDSGVERPRAGGRPSPSAQAEEFEVMYALAGSEGLDALREELSVLGHSVVVVGDQTMAQVHVHLADAGAAVEAGLAYGRLSQVRITALPPATPPAAAERTVIAVVAGDGLAQVVRASGAVAVQPADRASALLELTSAIERAPGDVIVLPNDMENLELAIHLATELRRPDHRVAVIPTVSQVQGLAALAVHEPTAPYEEAVVAMSATSGHARHGAVTVAESGAMTMAGRCEVGDVLGVVDGDFVLIGATVLEVAVEVAERLLSAGAELLTVVVGVDADPELGAELTRRLEAAHRVEVDVITGGQSRYPLLLGAE